jgi:chromosome segregation ATPase
MTTPSAQTERDRLEKELARLVVKRRALDEALGEFLHEGRRTRDALERAGGREPALEAKARHLAQNAAMTRRELEETDREIEDLRGHLAALGADARK